MKKVYVFFFLFFSVLVVSAQENNTKIELEDNTKKLEISDDLNLELPKLNWDEQVKNDPLRPLKFEGFNKIYTHSVDEKLFYSLYGNLSIAPGLYTSQTAGGNIAVQINQSFLVNFGAYGLKYDHNFGFRPYYDAILHLNTSYQIFPWLTVGAYGQYAAFSRYNAQHGSMLHSPMVPYSGYGVHATTMFTEVFGIQGTVGQEYNPFNGKWQSVYGISPVINLNGLFK